MRELAPIQAGNASVRQVLENYQQYSDAKTSTKMNRQRVYDLFNEGFGLHEASHIKPIDLMNWLGSRKEWGTAGTKKWAVANIQAAFSWAAIIGLIPLNQLAKLRLPSGERAHGMRSDQYQQLQLVTRGAFRELIRFMRATGCRPGEATNLKWRDVSIVNQCATLQEHKTKKRTRKPRIIPLSQAAVEILRRLLDTYGDIDLNAYVFHTRWARQFRRSVISGRLRTARKRARPHGILKGATLHGIRHLFATEAVQNGMSLPVLSKILGHASIKTTVDRYVHLDGDVPTMVKALERMGFASRNRPKQQGIPLTEVFSNGDGQRGDVSCSALLDG